MSRVIRLAAVSGDYSSRPYLLYDIEEDARSLVESAREKAQAIIEEAKDEAERLLENLRRFLRQRVSEKAPFDETISRLLEMFSEPQEAGRTEREMQEVGEGCK